MTNRAYTLIELLVAMTIGLIISGVTVGIFLNQQVAFKAIDLARTAQDASRDAMLEMEPALRRAGFGIDPRYALDFNHYACAQTPCRDHIDAPDEIVFVARDPMYSWNDLNQNGCLLQGGCFSGNAWSILSAAGTSITIQANAGDQFLKGRVIEAVCIGGSEATMATVAATSTASAAGALTLQLQPAAAGNPYEENNFGSACYVQPGAALFLVDRYRYAITTFNGTPYLVLDTGLDLNQDGVTPDQGDLNDLVPVAKDVEDMQIAYQLNAAIPNPACPSPPYPYTAPDSNGNWVVGDQPGVREEPDPVATAPIYQTDNCDPSRYNMNPANVMGVRVTISVRSTQPDLSQPRTWLGDPLQMSENRNVQLTSLGGYRRYVTSTTTALRNMSARSMAVF